MADIVDSKEEKAERARRRKELAASGLAICRYGRLADKNRDFDLADWQAQDTTARWRAAWELVEHYLVRRGCADELRLRRDVAVYRRMRRPRPRR